MPSWANFFFGQTMFKQKGNYLSLNINLAFCSLLYLTVPRPLSEHRMNFTYTVFDFLGAEWETAE